MKGLAWGLMLIFLLGACATGAEQARMQSLFDKYDHHCREHARELAGEADEAARYEECMTYYIKTDEDCPICTLDSHLTKAKQ
ncbi:MAG: hypothetical protein C0619_14120 [Desulfuromonas sp.]|jgi:hypothetical protein|nr:MAG: hypothetical protein C0619_14120 [Desulfuromonas sp.]